MTIKFSYPLRIADKPISFELSMGNAGNSLDGQLATVAHDDTDSPDVEDTLRASWHSSTAPSKPLSHDRLYYFLPVWDDKPSLHIRALQPDHRRRMYSANALGRLGDRLEEGLHEVHSLLEAESDQAEQKLKETLEQLQVSRICCLIL